MDLTGQKFGRLRVLGDGGKRSNDGHIVWLCHCSCGNTAQIQTNALKSGDTKSCGCLRKETAKKLLSLVQYTGKTHGESNTRLYQTWRAMKDRCSNSNVLAYKTYGKRGIKVCEKWIHSYVSFRDWALSHGYADNLTIDRIDNDGNYCPENCQWLTRTQNSSKGRKQRR